MIDADYFIHLIEKRIFEIWNYRHILLKKVVGLYICMTNMRLIRVCISGFITMIVKLVIIDDDRRT